MAQFQLNEVSGGIVAPQDGISSAGPFVVSLAQGKQRVEGRCNAGVYCFSNTEPVLRPGCWLDDRGVLGRFPVGARDFSVLQNDDTGSGAYATEACTCSITSIQCRRGTAVARWLRCSATNRKVAGSIPAGVIGIFH